MASQVELEMKKIVSPEIKILLVDDREDNLLSIETVLEKDGYRFFKARSGKEALKILLKEQDFSLILMDVQMPEINGFETAELIYQREKLKEIPIIFITAYNYGDDNIFKGYKSGAVDYIYKPINPELLKLKVSIFIELYRKNYLLRLQEQKLKKMNVELQNEIKERVKYEEELQIKNQQLNEAQKMSNLSSWEWDLISNQITGSSEFYKLYCFSNSDILDFNRFSSIIYPEDQDLVIKSLASVINNHQAIDIVYRFVAPSNEIRIINLKARAVVNERGESNKIFGTSQDITKIRQTEEQLRVFYILEKFLNETYIFDAETYKFQYINDDACQNLGYTREELMLMSPKDIVSEFNEGEFLFYSQSLKENPSEKIVYKTNHKRKDNSTYPVEVHLQLIEKLNTRVYLAIVIDITEREKAEEKIKASLKEKEILLKEIHHRVKNNLQVISSLLNLQSQYISDEQTRSIFIESKNRVISMALIHEKLYKYDDLTRIYFNEYIRDLADNLIRSYKINTNSISLQIDNLSDVYLDIGTSIPLGLCVNELLTNSLKYAFPDGREGEIKIRLKSYKDQLQVAISDNGVGIPKHLDLNNLQTLGMQLISSLVDQLEGKMEVMANGRTEFKLTIPLHKSDPTPTLL
jgi:PAS domain S-box-containing protein